ncbi:hypothetical protein A9K55_000220 [Cordyceps militaris]|uniref:Uncharacterized protein n=1 Tax=Cordyceps militaris TaxID=73501 RepID=A0A2H4SW33_CORMI|nr:hypothetical protein A9K55_000220 [Cordyceps militaris]
MHLMTCTSIAQGPPAKTSLLSSQTDNATEDEINIMARCKEDEMFFFFLDGYPTEMERSVVNSSITDPCPLLALRSWHGDPLISLPIKPFYEAINAISAISLVF